MYLKLINICYNVLIFLIYIDIIKEKFISKSWNELDMNWLFLKCNEIVWINMEAWKSVENVYELSNEMSIEEKKVVFDLVYE